MASNQPFNLGNRLAPQGYQPAFGGFPTAPAMGGRPLTVDTTGGATQTGLPAWLTDLSARGIGNNFAPDAGQPSGPIQFTPRDDQTPTPAPAAPAGPMQNSVPIDPYGNAESQQNRGEAGDHGGAGNGNEPQSAGAQAGGFGGIGSLGGIGLDLGPFGDRLPSTTSMGLGTAGKAAFGLGTMAMGPFGMALGVANTVANTVNTGLNTKALNMMGVNPSPIDLALGAAGMNGYGGLTASAMNQAMDTSQGRQAIGTAQNLGPSPDDVAEANKANPMDPGPAPDRSVETAPMDKSGDLSKDTPAAGGAAADISGSAGGAPDTGPDTAQGGPANFKGGVLTQNKLTGPNPKGPDTGFASVQAGEGILTRKAMAFYGPDFLDQLNKLAVPKNDNRLAPRRG